MSYHKRQTWQDRVRRVYDTLGELQAYDSVYGVVARCGFKSARALWDANPLIGGSVNPRDFGLAVRRG